MSKEKDYEVLLSATLEVRRSLVPEKGVFEGEPPICQIYVNNKRVGPPFRIVNNFIGYQLYSTEGGNIDDYQVPIIELIER